MTMIELATHDTLDNETVQSRIDELKELLENPEQTPLLEEPVECLRDELKALRSFQEICEEYCSDWKHGDSAISEDYFQDYIEQLIDDCYEIPKSTNWPYRHMTLDIKAAADEARQDYTCAELGNKTFYVR